MNILLVGGGGREHAIAWKLRQSPRVTDLFVAPGNAGTAAIAQNLKISPNDTRALVKAAQDNRIDLVVVGPEAPLTRGIVDAFGEVSIPAFGPSKKASQIEGSPKDSPAWIVMWKFSCRTKSKASR